MSTKPILFNTDMKSIRFPPTTANEDIRAILANRKTVTRRVAKDAPNREDLKPCKTMGFGYGLIASNSRAYALKPPYHPGDILYVRETWSVCECEKCRAGIPSLGGECSCEYVYRTDYGKTEDDSFPPSMFKWHPSIHMPREAARIFLRVTDMRVERLQDITEDGARAEGALPMTTPNISGKGRTFTQGFGELWDSTIKPADRALYGWYANPWVWVIEFKRISREEATHGPG